MSTRASGEQSAKHDIEQQVMSVRLALLGSAVGTTRRSNPADFDEASRQLSVVSQPTKLRPRDVGYITSQEISTPPASITELNEYRSNPPVVTAANTESAPVIPIRPEQPVEAARAVQTVEEGEQARLTREAREKLSQIYPAA